MTETETVLETFRHYLHQIDALVARIAALPEADTLLATKAMPQSFDTGRQLGVAIYFAARGVYKPAGIPLPPFPKDFSAPTLRALAAEIGATLDGIKAADIRPEKVAHQAGFAELEQVPLDYMVRFALPNMMFHFAMGYAGLRAAGAPVGKAEFDGLHTYPDGFSF